MHRENTENILMNIIPDYLNLPDCILLLSRLNKSLNKIAHPDSYIWCRKNHIEPYVINFIFPLYFYPGKIWLYKLNMEEIIVQFGYRIKWMISRYHNIIDKKNFQPNDTSSQLFINDVWHSLYTVYTWCNYDDNCYFYKTEQKWIRRTNHRWLSSDQIIRPPLNEIKDLLRRTAVHSSRTTPPLL